MVPKRKLTTPRHLQITDLERVLWRARNFGVFSLIARDLGVSRNAVRQVFWGHSKSRRISKCLDAALGRQTWRVA